MNFLKSLLIWIFDTLALLLPVANRNNDHVAVIRLDAIGDFIIWLDSAKEIRKLFPKERIVLYANNAWSDYANKFDYWDEVYPVNTKKYTNNLIYRFQIMRSVKRMRYAKSLQPTYSRNFILGDSLIRATGSAIAIGYNGDLSNITSIAKWISDKWYSYLVDSNNQISHELEKNAYFMSKLLDTVYEAELPQLPRLFVGSYKIPATNYLTILPGAGWGGRQWPADKFADIAAIVSKKYGWRVVMLGSESDIPICNEIIMRSQLNAVNLAGKTSIAEYIEIIRNAEILICNETSAVHIAAAVKTKAVCILGGGHFGRFMPYGNNYGSTVMPLAAYNEMPCFNCNWHCRYSLGLSGTVPCISNIEVRKVEDLIIKSIEN